MKLVLIDEANVHRLVANIETAPGFLCEYCDALSDESAGCPLYDCESCGSRFNRDDSADGDSSRCPTCNKFSAKTADDSCAECGSGPVDEVTLAMCPICEDWVIRDEIAKHIMDGCR
jgi:hypothetical protein